MGLPAITSLNVAKQIGEVVKWTDIKQQFPKVFAGLGNLGEDYSIKLREGAVPYSLFTPWNVAIPLQDKVQKELERMEAMGVSGGSRGVPWVRGPPLFSLNLHLDCTVLL